jgi:hypothetical protein
MIVVEAFHEFKIVLQGSLFIYDVHREEERVVQIYFVGFEKVS